MKCRGVFSMVERHEPCWAATMTQNERSWRPWLGAGTTTAIALALLGGLGCSGSAVDGPDRSRADSSSGGAQNQAQAGSNGGSAQNQATGGNCGGASSPFATDTPRPPQPDGAGIDPAALVGCRSPEQPCCAGCYMQRADGCYDRNGQAFDGQDVYYPNSGFIGGTCPNGSRCASCTFQDERELKQRLAQACDCSTPPGLDPCTVEDSCACTCARLPPLQAACPSTP